MSSHSEDNGEGGKKSPRIAVLEFYNCHILKSAVNNVCCGKTKNKILGHAHHRCIFEDLRLFLWLLVQWVLWSLMALWSTRIFQPQDWLPLPGGSDLAIGRNFNKRISKIYFQMFKETHSQCFTMISYQFTNLKPTENLWWGEMSTCINLSI